MAQGFDIKEVIQQSTSDVPLSELAKKGFKRVKVLNKDTVNQLIAEAVDRVVSERLQQATAEERQQIESAARSEFNSLVKEQRETTGELEAHQQKVARLENELGVRKTELESAREQWNRDKEDIEGYRQRIVAAETESKILKENLRDREAELRVLLQQSSGGDMRALQESIEMLGKKIGSSGGSGGGGAPASTHVEVEQTDFAVRSMLASAGDAKIESNVQNVEAKAAKSKGVNNTLAKLKSMKKGGGG